MRRFAEVWNEDEFVQQIPAQLPWFHNGPSDPQRGYTLNRSVARESRALGNDSWNFRRLPRSVISASWACYGRSMISDFPRRP